MLLIGKLQQGIRQHKTPIIVGISMNYEANKIDIDIYDGALGNWHTVCRE